MSDYKPGGENIPDEPEASCTPESKQGLRKIRIILMAVCQRTKELTTRALNGQCWKNLSKKINKIALDYI